MAIGRHLVRDLFCQACSNHLGWFIVVEQVRDPDEKYVEGKFVLERLQLVDIGAGKGLGSGLWARGA